YLANERNLRTVYLSITRGDGGQNLIGKEQGEELGMIRTRELLEARKVDGAEQFFTKANDFGFSKNPEESFTIWNKEAVLADVVWTIRKFRPDVIINRFPTTGEGGHGHHTASAILAIEAFRAAADPLRFPEQLKTVTPWQARRIFHNSFIPRGQPQKDMSSHLKLDVGAYNPLLGISYGEMAAASRSMHKSQGFGVASSRGLSIEYFNKLDGDTNVTEIFEGIETGWNRIENSGTLSVLILKTEQDFDAAHPERSVSSLLEILKQIRKLDDAYWKEVKTKEVTRLIAACAGLWMEVNAGSYYSSPGDTFEFTVSVISRLMPAIKLEKISLNNWDTLPQLDLTKNEVWSMSKKLVLDKQTPYSNPYWLNQSHEPGMYRVEDAKKTGQPWNNDFPEAVIQLNFNGELLSFTVPVTHKWTDPVRGELYRPFEVLPAVSINPSEKILVFTEAENKTLNVLVQSYTDSLSGTLQINPPAGWSVIPGSFDVNFEKKGSEKSFDFVVIPPKTVKNSDAKNVSLEITFKTKDNQYNSRITRIAYDHIPPLVRISTSNVKLVKVDLQSKAKKIGYIEGAGDEVARSLEQAGFDVTILDDHQIRNTSLAQYDAIVTGIRAYNTIERMDAWYVPLMKYVENGGNLIVQYNTSNFLSSINSPVGPYPFKITRERVTVENAPVEFEDPSHFLLNSPNKITQADFEGWIQERGLYFAGELAPEYKSVLKMNDPGEKANSGSIIIAQKGKGYFIYTGIAFFRQLPAGVPGAYRLMTNLLNAGK
ncbi:MAG: PIG-L family deacetylase, partial [Bacteroidota bacterium]|nr:PIG-L family deacetylase [Bacteroidota bacterium]